jgi:probable rRNA maturation factor
MSKHSPKKSKRIIEIHSAHPQLVLPKKDVRMMFLMLDEIMDYSFPQGSLSIAFLNDAALTSLHRQFLKDPTPTDVITFPGDEDGDFAGEICVSVDRAYTEAPKHGNDFSDELILYLVHGWLHLAGEDDLTDNTVAQMRSAEKAALAILREKGIWPNFSMRGTKF